MSNKDKINLVDGKYSIRDLVDLEELRKIFESFTLATGFTIGFLEHPSLEILIATGWRDICTKFHRAYPESIEYCLESNKKLIGKLKRPGQLVIEECENGLVDCATPIIIKGKHVATLATGQVLLKKPDIKWFKKKAQTHGYDVGKYLEALNEVLIVPRKKLKQITSFLSELAVFIADLGLNNLEIKETAVILEAEITERKRAEESLKEREALLQLQFERMPIGCITWDIDFRVLLWNPSSEKIFGFTEEEAKGKHPYDIIVPKDAQPHVDTIWKRLLEGDITAQSVNENITKDGHTITCEWFNTPLKRPNGKVIGVISMVQDISERKKLEEQLVQSQKIEAIGSLAGGVAHDFNNILTAIIGYGTLLAKEIGNDKLLSSYTKYILDSAERAAKLTSALLAFSRKQMISLKPINVNETVFGVEKLLLRLIGEDIEFTTILAEEDLTVMADSGQIEQILMNLAINARDAMPNGGSLLIKTERVEFDDAYIKAHGYGNQGMYALLTVEDTGHGMDEKTKEQIFNPFFTTKEVGKGTGLGLSMVYGLVKQHNGFITCYSEVGKGTIFKIHLPLIESERIEKKPKNHSILKGGTETILVAEDDAMVREFIVEMLKGYGFTVIEAIDGEEAIKAFNENKDNIQLLILDAIMPKKNGKEVYNEIKKVRPDIKNVFISGYDADIIHKKGFVEEGLNFISKPISPNDFIKKVREVLDG